MIRAIFLVLLNCIIFISTSVAEEQPQGPKLVVVNPNFDFGSVLTGETIKHSFLLKNEGDTQLSIERIIPSCACTIVNNKFKHIPANQEKELEVEFNTFGFRGQQNKVIRIITNEQQLKQHSLYLQGDVQPEILLSPERVFLGNIHRSKIASLSPVEVNIAVNKAAKADIKISSVISPAKFVEIESESGDAKNRKVVLKLNAPKKNGIFRERLIVQLENAQQKSINIPVFYKIINDLELEPPVLSFGLLAKDQKEKKVILRNSASKPIKRIKLIDSKPSFKSSYKVIEKGREYQISVLVDPKQLSEDLDENIDVYLLNEDNQEFKLSLPVIAVLQASK